MMGPPEKGEEVLKVKGAYYVLSTSALADDRRRVLKQGETFAVLNRYGDVQRTGLMEQGLYHKGTRYLSVMDLHLAGKRPLLLSSTVREDNALLAAHLTNPDYKQQGDRRVPRGTLHVARTKVLWEGACHEEIRVANYGRETVELPLTVSFGADHADVFEVRGTHRAKKGRALPPERGRDHVVLAYAGLDNVVRRTRVSGSPAPDEVADDALTWRLKVPPGGTLTRFLTVSCHEGAPAAPPASDYDEAVARARASLRTALARSASVSTSNAQFDDWVRRSFTDLHMMVTETPHGPYPYAGVPWFSTPFGRDGLIAALQTLWVDPRIARGVLEFLAVTQADEADPARDAEPGKILHESRHGEMAALGEVPYKRYYGSVDAVPLFVVLAGKYLAHTGDVPFVRKLWPHVDAALAWIDKYGDVDGDGFVEYAKRASNGLVNQGWKDSHDAVSHADGRLAKPPIALAEVQGYVFDAKARAAEIADIVGETDRARELRDAARDLRDRFQDAFWIDDLDTYALALDGENRPCRVRASNPGHCLWSGIASTDHARRIGKAMLSDDLWSGFGIRTLARGEARFNPMSYHNGSVWPHDNALIAAGFARYGLKEEAVRVLSGIFDAALFTDLHRLPELFCGFRRQPGEGPTLFPTACAPQAWAAGSAFMLLAAALGLDADARARRLVLDRPLLPPFLDRVHVKNLHVGDAVVDLALRRHDEDVGVNVTRREGHVDVHVVK